MTNQRFLNMLLVVIVCLVSGCSSKMSTKEPFVTVLTNDGNYQELLSGEPQTCGMRSGRVYLKPGEDCGEHSTDDHEELLIFLEGSGEAIIGKGKTLTVGSGKTLYVPPHTPHYIKNNSDKPLCYIYCVAPANNK
jgi:mannose-6-phosphate isomerase-like protein (cupin superfamily)